MTVIIYQGVGQEPDHLAALKTLLQTHTECGGFPQFSERTSLQCLNSAVLSWSGFSVAAIPLYITISFHLSLSISFIMGYLVNPEVLVIPTLMNSILGP